MGCVHGGCYQQLFGGPGCVSHVPGVGLFTWTPTATLGKGTFSFRELPGGAAGEACSASVGADPSLPDTGKKDPPTFRTIGLSDFSQAFLEIWLLLCACMRGAL